MRKLLLMVAIVALSGCAPQLTPAEHCRIYTKQLDVETCLATVTQLQQQRMAAASLAAGMQSLSNMEANQVRQSELTIQTVNEFKSSIPSGQGTYSMPSNPVFVAPAYSPPNYIQILRSTQPLYMQQNPTFMYQPPWAEGE
jgi:hypothetical protein